MSLATVGCPACPRCKSADNVIPWREGVRRLLWWCRSCGKPFVETRRAITQRERM